MRLYIDNKIILILFESDEELTQTREHFTVEDKSNVFMGGTYDYRKIKKKVFLKKKKEFYYLNSGFLYDLITFVKDNKFKITELKDKRTKFPYQKKEYTDEELKEYFPDFNYVGHQVESLRALTKTNVGIIQAPTSSGKCFAKGTKVIMFDGTLKNVEDVIIGDKLLGPDSKERIVLSKHNGRDNLYKINQHRANSYVVNSEHLLCLKITGGAKLGKIKNGEYINISVKDYINKSKYFKHCAKGYKSQLIKWNKQKTSNLLNPYLLGLWLGDGRNNNITITNIDEEVIEFLNEFVFANENFELVEYNYGEKASSYHIKDLNNTKKHRILEELRKYNLLNNKHIPKEYKINTEEIRLNVLAGLIDSDGYYDKRCNKIEITLKDKKLAEDIVFVSQSLGFHSILNECIKSAHTNHKEKYFRIYISGDIYKIPVKVKRKKAQNKKMRTNCLLHGIKSVESVGVDKYFGFSVDGDNKFLLNDFTVVHNSETIIAFLKLSRLPTLILVNRVSLALQLQERIQNNGIKNVGICYGGGVEDGDVVVSTIGSVKKLPSLTKFKALIVDECFPGKTLVHTEDGMKTISNICKTKYSGKVLSFNEKIKKFEYKKITNWFVKKEKKLLNISFSKNLKVKCTYNHPFYNNKFEKIDAIDLNIGDRIVVKPRDIKGNGISASISKEQRSAIIGMVLGDACIVKTKNLARIRLAQGENQKEYLLFKKNVLSNLFSTENLAEGVSGYNKNNKVFSITSKASVELLDLYNKFYNKGIKSIKNIIDEIDEISLAFWMMDDGCLQKNNEHYELATHSFSKEENEKIIKLFKDKFNINSFLKKDNRCNKYWIYIRKESTNIIASLICKYTPQSMEYKLPEKFKGKLCFNPEKLEYGFLEINNISTVKNIYNTVYNITVKDNHNYFVNSGFLVGNCHRASAKGFQDFLSKAPYPIRFGFSATPNSGDNYKWTKIRQFLGTIIYKIDPELLMEKEVIAKPTIEFVPVEAPPTPNWPMANIHGIVKNKKRNDKIKELVEDFNVPTLILIRNLEHGKTLNESIDDSVFVSGIDDAIKRKEVIHNFENGKLKVVIASGIFNEGISIDAVKLLIIASGGKSKIETIQRLGRGLRLTLKKHSVSVFDFEDYGNYYTQKHSKMRKNIYKKAGFEVVN